MNKPDILTTIQSSGVTLKKAGRGIWKARCPFHAENTPSFTVYEETQSWYCFGACGTGGDVYDFIQQLHNCDFKEAKAILGEKTIRQVDTLARPEKPQKKPSVFPGSLLDRYISHKRKYELWQQHKPLTNASIDRWQLGVGVLPYGDRAERLIVPIQRNGHLVMVRGRALDNHPVKWQTCGSPPRLFGTRDIDFGSTIFIVANMIDALLWRQLPYQLFGLDKPHVAIAPTSGEQGWQRGWGKALQSLEPEQIYIAYDNDEAGRRGAAKVLQDCQGLPAGVWTWPAGTPEKFDIGALYESTQ